MDANKDIDVSDDYLVLQQVMDEYEITVKRLCNETGRAEPTVYRYRTGEATVPMFVWRTLWRLTGDQRVIKLIMGDEPFQVVPLPSHEMAVDITTIEELLKCRAEQINCERAVLAILADGEIDANDRPEIEKYQLDFAKMLQTQCQIHWSILNRYHQQYQKRGRR
jgi:hypothetical protein